MDSLLPSDPASIDGYVIEGRLGSGGFGIVYAATSPDGSPVAVKVLRPELSDDPRLRERLAREADALSRVAGERTAEIFKVVTEGDLVYLVMERVEGESLTDQVNDNGALSGPMLWFAGTGLVQALQEIHAAGIVHRDLKPSNVMYGPDGVKVLDFGISVVADETSLTQTGAFVGTGAWMAPEMVLGNDITEKTDVYALGLVLAFIALGQHPFGEGRADALMYRILNTDPDLDGIPVPFVDAVSMCLQRDPDDRPSLDDLAGFFGSSGEQQISATSIVGSDTGSTRIVQPAAAATTSGGNRKRNVLIGTGIAAVIAAIGIIVGVTVGGGGGDDPIEVAESSDTELQSQDVVFVETEEEPEPVTTEEPVEEEVVEEEVVEEEVVEEEVVEEEVVGEEEKNLAVLTAEYSWGASSEASALQALLGLTADGYYGDSTRTAHITALETQGLTTTNVPTPPTTTTETVSESPAGASCTGVDNASPWISGVSVSSTTVDVSSGPVSVAVDVTAGDDNCGIVAGGLSFVTDQGMCESFGCPFTNVCPSSIFSGSTNWNDDPDSPYPSAQVVAGTVNNGTFRLNLQISPSDFYSCTSPLGVVEVFDPNNGEILGNPTWNAQSRTPWMFSTPSITVINNAADVVPNAPVYDRGNHLFCWWDTRFVKPTEFGSEIVHYNAEVIIGDSDLWVPETFETYEYGDQYVGIRLTGLNAGTTYQLRVRAVNGAGIGPWSTAATFTTLASNSDEDGNPCP